MFFGIFVGYFVVEIICAFFVYGVGRCLPAALGVLKYVGAAYILWLAVHIAFSKQEPMSEERSASFWKGFLLQFVNVKIYLFGITALTGYITDYSTALSVLLFFEIVIATIGTIATLTWIGMGVLIRELYQKHFRLINILLSLLLLQCVYSILR